MSYVRLVVSYARLTMSYVRHSKSYVVFERERQVYLQPDGLDSNTYNTYNINIIKYLQYGRHTGTTNICLLPIVQSPWY